MYMCCQNVLQRWAFWLNHWADGKWSVHSNQACDLSHEIMLDIQVPANASNVCIETKAGTHKTDPQYIKKHFGWLLISLPQSKFCTCPLSFTAVSTSTFEYFCDIMAPILWSDWFRQGVLCDGLIILNKIIMLCQTHCLQYIYYTILKKYLHSILCGLGTACVQLTVQNFESDICTCI